jgi:hypothetical protein
MKYSRVAKSCAISAVIGAFFDAAWSARVHEVEVVPVGLVLVRFIEGVMFYSARGAIVGLVFSSVAIFVVLQIMAPKGKKEVEIIVSGTDSRGGC